MPRRAMQKIVKRPEIDRRTAITRVEHALPVRRLGRLFEHQEQLAQATFAGAVVAKEDS